ncbi:MAG: hypothetical protein A2047_00050 [Omnitrophica bacterium GWA2_41_15]|nr:MAG: hypothetical protein A2047_00050 [Omnitrophica bacterium GWA2_41_15]
MPFPDAVDEVIAHFLTEYDVESRPQLLRSYITSLLRQQYVQERVSEIVEKYYDTIQEILIKEHDSRLKSEQLLRYDFVDATGTKIKGIGRSYAQRQNIFQNALNGISDSVFEQFSAIVLKWMGCREVWVTPASHDQGLDAFGYSYDLKKYLSSKSECVIVMLAQAKHYIKTKIGTKEIREFVGAFGLAIHKIFSSVDDKYEQLEIKPFGPAVLVFLTTQEVPQTVKRLATRSGIVVLTTEDIYEMFYKRGVLRHAKWSQRSIKLQFERLVQNTVVAK